MKTFIKPVRSKSPEAEVIHSYCQALGFHPCGQAESILEHVHLDLRAAPKEELRGPAVPVHQSPTPLAPASDAWPQGRNSDQTPEAAVSGAWSPWQQSWQSPRLTLLPPSHIHSAQGLSARLGRRHNRHLGLLPSLLLEEQRSGMPVMCEHVAQPNLWQEAPKVGGRCVCVGKTVSSAHWCRVASGVGGTTALLYQVEGREA